MSEREIRSKTMGNYTNNYFHYAKNHELNMSVTDNILSFLEWTTEEFETSYQIPAVLTFILAEVN